MIHYVTLLLRIIHMQGVPKNVYTLQYIHLLQEQFRDAEFYI